MRLAVVSDCHIGNHTAFAGVEVGRINARCRQVLDSLEAALGLALDAGCDAFVMAGDVFDTDHPYPDHLAALIFMLRNAQRRGLSIHILVGNHDQHSNTPGDHALSPLALDFQVYETPFILERLPRVLMCPYGYNVTDMLDVTVDVAIAHHGIADDATHPAKASSQWVRHVNAIRQWMKQTGCNLYLSGDWHERRTWDGGRIQQIGAMAPVNWTNRAYIPGREDPYGSVVLVTENGVDRAVVPGPRFLRATSVEEAEVLRQATQREGKFPYIDLIGDFTGKVPQHLQPFVKTSGAAEAKTEVVAAVVESVRSDASVEEQVSLYIDNDTEIPDEIRERVRTTVTKAMKEARCQT